jgi:hypothetical protein
MEGMESKLRIGVYTARLPEPVSAQAGVTDAAPQFALRATLALHRASAVL